MKQNWLYRRVLNQGTFRALNNNMVMVIRMLMASCEDKQAERFGKTPTLMILIAQFNI